MPLDSATGNVVLYQYYHYNNRKNSYVSYVTITTKLCNPQYLFLLLIDVTSSVKRVDYETKVKKILKMPSKVRNKLGQNILFVELITNLQPKTRIATKEVKKLMQTEN